MKKLVFPALALLAGLIVVAGCKKKTPVAVAVYAVKYEVTASAGNATIIIENVNGNRQTFSNSALTWTHQFSAEAGAELYINATSTSLLTTITVKIFRDGNEVASDSTPGVLPSATASFTL